MTGALQTPNVLGMDHVNFLRQAADLLGSGRVLAQLLDVHERTVSKWLNGNHAPRPGVIADVRHLLQERAQRCLALAEEDIAP